MDLYRGTFAGLVLLNSTALYRSYRSHKAASLEHHIQETKNENRGHEDEDAAKVRHLTWLFLPVYLLVNGADWLQGPYIYPIYKDEKGLEESVVALLFMTGFLSGGISASFAGSFADRFGRKAACLAYCVIYSISCLTLLSDHIVVLFFGRILGGICGTLLYSVFESWLVAEFNKLVLDDQSSSHLSGIFSTMTTCNSVVAVVAGVVAESLVRYTGTAKTPFMASMACLGLAFVTISKNWKENFGERSIDPSEKASLLSEEANEEAAPAKSTFQSILMDKNILTLALTSCFFEGSLFLFIFFKFPALKLCHELTGATTDLPFGLIFAILMSSMMLGSMIYNHVVATSSGTPTKRILIGTLLVASLCFFAPAYVRDERITLWCFCIFEACCGLYYPAMSTLKGKLVDDGSRASLYGILRVPLNAFVVLALSTTTEGEYHRSMIFVICSALIMSAAGVIHRVLA